MIYLVVECPHCRRAQILQIEKTDKIYEKSYKCKYCGRYFKLKYSKRMKKSSWIISVFNNPKKARDFVARLNLLNLNENNI